MQVGEMRMSEDDIKAFVIPLYADKDSMHNFNHILRIRERVDLYKASCGHVDENKLTFLLNFHGLIPYVKDHEEEVVRMGFPSEWLEALYRHITNPVSIEEQLVSDANAWETVGEFGIRKSLQVGKERGRSLKETLDFMRENIKRVVFYTEPGKHYGEPGIEVVENFLRKCEAAQSSLDGDLPK